MSTSDSRRKAIKRIVGSATLLSGAGIILPAAARAEAVKEQMKEDLDTWKLKGRVNHSVCKWCYPNIPLEDLCKSAKEIGLSSIELLGPEEWPTLRKYDLTCAMPWGAGKGIVDGWNDPKLHDELLASFEDV